MHYLALFAVSLLLSACALTSSTAGSDPTQLASRQIELRQLDVPYEVAYRAATQALFSLGYKVDHSDKTSGLLTGSRMVDVQAAKDHARQKTLLGMVPYVGLMTILTPTKEATSLQITMFLQPAAERKTDIRFKMQVNGEPAWDPVIVDQLWVTTQRETLIESGPTVRTKESQAQVAVAAPAPASPPAPVVRDRWAVVIGVGRYESPEIPKLRYTVSDAEAIYQTLIGPAGFKKEHVLLLTDTTEKRPTNRNIRWALGTFLARSAKKDDMVLIFFAGHGAPEVDPRGIERDGLAKYLVPIDAEHDDLYSTALPMDELQTIFGRIEAERVVAFLDSCYSGAAGGRTFVSKKTRATNVDDLFLERLTRSKGRAIITASRPAEVSIELPELGHGVFTHYLVQGLKGAADLNRDGIVTLQELYEYLEQQVTQKSRSVGGSQHPVMKGELEGVLPLVKVAR